MNIVCIVQARMGSERLPGKVIKPIMGKAMVLYTLNRLNQSKYINTLILATSTLERDNPLVSLVLENGFQVFRGDEDHVLKRYKEASDLYKGDIIIRVTGDCPLIDPIIVDHVISNFIMMDYDYIRLDVPNTFIRGFDVEIFSKEALDRTYELVEEDIYKEHVTLYMYNHPEQFKIGYISGETFYNKQYRLCVDTEEDFKLVEHIFSYFNNEFVTSKEIVEYLDENPDIASMNLEIKQRNIEI